MKKIKPTEEKKPQPQIMNIGKTLVLILTYPDNSIPIELAWWFMNRGFNPNNIATLCEKGMYDVVRNKALKSVEPLLDKFEWLMLIDNDMRPNNLTDMFLLEQGDNDVVACNYKTIDTATITPDAFHLGLVRIKTSKVKELFALSKKDGKPLFAFPRNADNSQLVGCECSWFASRLKEVGAKIVRIGWADHYKSKFN
jgi:hypothetical protein